MITLELDETDWGLEPLLERLGDDGICLTKGGKVRAILTRPGEAFVQDDRQEPYLPAQKTEELVALKQALAEVTEKREKAIEQAQRDREILSATVEALDEGFVIFNEQDRLVLWNSAYCEAYFPGQNLKAGEIFTDLVKRTVGEGRIVDALGQEESWKQRRLKHHQEARSAMEFELADGRWLRVEERRTADGMTVGLHRDITELKQNEEVIDLREAQLRQAQRMAKIGIFVWDDLNDRCEYCSEELADLLGISVDEFMRSRGSHEAILPWIHEEDREHYDAVIQSALVAGRAYDVEYRVRDSQGELLYWRELGEPVLDDDGRQVSTFGTVQDVSALKQTQAELVASERRYRGLFEQSPVPIMEEDWSATKPILENFVKTGIEDLGRYFDENLDFVAELYDTGRVVGISQSALDLYGVADEEAFVRAMLGANASEDELRGFGHMLAALMLGQKSYEYEAVEKHSTGRELVIQTQIVLPHQYEEDWSRVLISLEDVTDRKAAEDQLRQAQKMEAIGQLTGGVAHDFNNLLAVILGNAEMLSLAQDEGDPRLASILRSARRGAELTQRLLAFSRKQDLQPRALDLRTLIDGLAGLLERSLGETITLRLTYEPGPFWIIADPGQLENALLNLAINARDAMPEGGDLEIALQRLQHADASAAGEENDEQVALVVKDSGEGMSEAVLERAAEPFFTTKGVGHGSGLGLSMVYGFVSQTGGSMLIESEVGEGASVSLFFPLAARPSDRRDHAAVTTPRAKGETILLVEDEEEVRKLACDMLESLGYEVLQAPDGWTALAILDYSTPPALLLSDVVLPQGMSGQDLAERVVEHYPEIKTLLMSGYPRQNSAIGLLTNFGNRLMNKPFTQHELALRVREVLDS